MKVWQIQIHDVINTRTLNAKPIWCCTLSLLNVVNKVIINSANLNNNKGSVEEKHELYRFALISVRIAISFLNLPGKNIVCTTVTNMLHLCLDENSETYMHKTSTVRLCSRHHANRFAASFEQEGRSYLQTLLLPRCGFWKEEKRYTNNGE